MLIIFCGQDRSGKSTTMAALIEYLKSTYPAKKIHKYHFGASPNEKYARAVYSNQMIELTDQSRDDIIICDRFHGGEYVYSPIYRNYSGDFVFDYENKYLDFDNTYLIITTAAPEVLMSRDDGDSLSENHIVKIKDEQNRFKEFFNKTNIINKMIVYSDVDTTEQIIENIVGEFNL